MKILHAGHEGGHERDHGGGHRAGREGDQEAGLVTNVILKMQNPTLAVDSLLKEEREDQAGLEKVVLDKEEMTGVGCLLSFSLCAYAI